MRRLMLVAAVAAALVACGEQESLVLLQIRAARPLPYVDSVEVKVAGLSLTIGGLVGVPGPEQAPLQIGVYVPAGVHANQQAWTNVVVASEQGQCSVAQAVLGPIDLKAGESTGPLLVELSPHPATCRSEVAQACAEATKSTCQLFASCFDGFFLRTSFTDIEDCERSQRNTCVSSSSSTVSAILTCGKATQNSLGSCDRVFDLFFGEVLPGCELISFGDIKTGDACVADAQCKGGTCERAAGAMCGRCGQRPGFGQPCDLRGRCGMGLQCSATGRCQLPARTGEPCGVDAPCVVGLTCVGATLSAPGRCAPTAQMGERCSTIGSVETPAPLCAQQLWCNTTTLTCERRQTTSSACGLTVDGGHAMCTAGLECSAFKNGVCIKEKSIGEACDPSTPDCPGPLVCAAHPITRKPVCRLPNLSECK